MSNDETRISRRGFFKKAALGGAAVAGTGALAGLTASTIPLENPQDLYEKDVRLGDRILAQKEYVVMTDAEKEEMLEVILSDQRNIA